MATPPRYLAATSLLGVGLCACAPQAPPAVDVPRVAPTAAPASAPNLSR
ncbi:MAG: hypothetical protein R3B70_15610 [Polyangiaceae bacterium]